MSNIKATNLQVSNISFYITGNTNTLVFTYVY